MLRKPSSAVFVSSLFLWAVLVWGLPCEANWSSTYGGTASDILRYIQQTTDGGYIAAGYTESFGAGSNDAWLLKLDGSGNVTWQKTYGGTAYDYATSSQQTTDGGYIVSGGTESFGSGSNDIWLLKLDGSGNVAWQKTYGGTALDVFYQAQQTTDGGYIAAGYTTSFGSGSNDIWLLKLDGSGNVTWQKTYGGTASDYATSVQQTADGGYIVAGGTRSFGAGDNDIWLLKLDGSGNVTWEKTYGGTEYDIATSVRQTTDGGYIVGGGTISFAAGVEYAWLLKLDGSGNVTWEKTYSWTANSYASSVQQTTDGGYIVAGFTESFDASNNDAWLLKLDGGGNITWQKTYGDAGYEYVQSVRQTTDGGYIAAVDTDSFGAGNRDAWLLKLDGSGSMGSCSFEGISTATVSDTAATVIDTNAITGTTSIAGVDTTIVPIASNALSTKVCPLSETYQGTIGTQFTLTDSGFGTKKGKVLIGDVATKITSWTDTQIMCTVKKVPLPIGTYNVSIISKTIAAITLDDAFTVKNPWITSHSPASGIPGTEVTVNGTFFGGKKGKVYLVSQSTGKKKSCKVTSWYMDPTDGTNSEIKFVVPKVDPGGYWLYISNKAGNSPIDVPYQVN